MSNFDLLPVNNISAVIYNFHWLGSPLHYRVPKGALEPHHAGFYFYFYSFPGVYFYIACFSISLIILLAMNEH